MKSLKYFSFILLLITASEIYSQQKNILIFDPIGVSESFQYSFSQLTNDSVIVADTLDESVLNFDALFLFINYPFELTNEEGNILIDYVDLSNPVYLYSKIGSNLDSVSFWGHIGVTGFAGLATSVLVDSVVGVNTSFVQDVTIDTSFMSGYIPVVFGNVDSILIGVGEGPDINTTYISSYDSLNVIIDLYNLIDNEGFLKKVLEYFKLIPVHQNLIEFHPPVDTALVLGGCTTPEIVCKNLVSTNERDSISIEPGFNTYFYYFDSSGYQVPLDNYYFIVIDSLNEFEYELWYHPYIFPSDPALIEFDSIFFSDYSNFDIQLIVKKNGLRIDSLSQPFHADYGLGVDDGDFSTERFQLYQNYPNPFNPVTSVKYAVGNRQLVSLIVFDILGKEVATLVSEEKTTGEYEVEFDGTDLPSGIYFYRLQSGNFVETKKMILLR